MPSVQTSQARIIINTIVLVAQEEQARRELSQETLEER